MWHHSVPHFLFVLFAYIVKEQELGEGKHYYYKDYPGVKGGHDCYCNGNGYYLHAHYLHISHHSLNALPVACGGSFGFLEPVEHLGSFQSLILHAQSFCDTLLDYHKPYICKAYAHFHRRYGVEPHEQKLSCRGNKRKIQQRLYILIGGACLLFYHIYYKLTDEAPQIGH